MKANLLVAIRMPMIRVVCLLLVSLFMTVEAYAATRLKIVASRAPIYSIVSLLSDGIGHDIQLALPIGEDPDGLSAGDLKHTRFASLIFLFDNQVDDFIFRNRKLYQRAKRVQLGSITRLWLHANDTTLDADRSILRNKKYSWLSPSEAIRMASMIETELINADPASKARYQSNMKKFVQNVRDIIKTIRTNFKNTLSGGGSLFFIGYDLKYFASYFNLGDSFMQEFSAAILQRSVTQDDTIACVVDDGQLHERDKRFVVNRLNLEVATIGPDDFASTDIKPTASVLRNYYFYNIRHIANSIVRCANKS